MKISMIAAMSKNKVIGSGGHIPWHISEDFKYFKSKTLNKPIIMGRKTFESLPGVLPKRVHKIITRNHKYNVEHSRCEVYGSLPLAIKSCKNCDEVFVIGGGEIYKEALDLDLIDTIYLTVINKEFDGDAFFPHISDKKFKLVSAEGSKDKELEYEFRIYGKNE